MSGRLSNISIGALKTSGAKKKFVDLTQIQTEQEISSEEAFYSLPEVQLIRDIPGSEPYLSPDLIPDLLYIYWQGGVSKIVKEHNITSPEKTRQQIIDFYTNNGFDFGFAGIVNQLEELTGDSQVETKANLGGIEAVLASIERADPKNPTSIIFTHPSQQVHEDTQKVETELILNEPDVIERDDLQCHQCGSRKIQTAIAQVSSGDEGGTMFARCVECKTKWITKMA